MKVAVAIALVLSVRFAQPQPESDTLTYSQQFRVEASAIARANCGKPYFGTWCGDPPRYVR